MRVLADKYSTAMSLPLIFKLSITSSELQPMDPVEPKIQTFLEIFSKKNIIKMKNSRKLNFLSLYENKKLN